MENNTTNPPSKGSGLSLFKWMLIIAGALVFVGIISSIDSANDQKAGEVEQARIAAMSVEEKLAEVASSTKSFRIDENTTSTAKIGEATRLFESWASVLVAASSTTSTAAVKQHDALVKEVRKIQVDSFPKLRTAFGALTAKRVWIEDMEVSVSGAKNDRILLVSTTFAANRNIVEAHASLMDVLKQLRFKKVDYKWISSASEWTSIDLESKKDQDL